MKCSGCKEDFIEQDLDESNDVPYYLFFIEGFKRKDRKNRADKYPRRWLCKLCHNDYEFALRQHFIKEALFFSKRYFGDKKEIRKNA